MGCSRKRWLKYIKASVAPFFPSPFRAAVLTAAAFLYHCPCCWVRCTARTMSKLFLGFLAVFLLSPLLVCLAVLALLYFVFARFCDLTETFFETLPWVKKRARTVKKGLGLATLRDIFSKLPHGKTAVSVSNQAGR